MQVLVVGPSWPFRGGIARTTTSLAEALAKQDALAGFCVPYRQYPRWLYPGEEDRDEAACPRLPQAKACFSLFNPFSWRFLRRAFEELTAEAVVVPHWTAAWAPLELFLVRQAVPVFAVVHNPFDHSGTSLSRWVSRKALCGVRGFLTHAKSVAWQLSRWFPQKPLRVHPLPPPPVTPVAKHHAREQLGIAQDAVVFLFFGLVRPYKGLDVLLDAARLLPSDRKWLLVVAGEVWGETAELAARVGDPFWRSRLMWHPQWVPEEESRIWFSAADVMVLPYRKATGSAVAAQALAYGLPLVATRTGGLEEVVEEGVNGLLAEPADVVSLAQALEQLLDPGKREQLAVGARRVGSRWSWSSYASCLLDLVREGLSVSS